MVPVLPDALSLADGAVNWFYLGPFQQFIVYVSFLAFYVYMFLYKITFAHT